jgi:hypothetical protein
MNKLDQYAERHFSLLESGAIWEGKITFRTLQSWVTGQTLRIKPSRGRGKRRGGKYGLMSQLKFGAAAHLLKTGLPTVGVQTFLDRFADSDFLPQTFAEKMSGRFLLCEDPSNRADLQIWFFQDEEKFWTAVQILIDKTPLRFATMHFGSILTEVVSRIKAWDERRQYVAKSAGGEYAKALATIRESNLADGLPVNTAPAETVSSPALLAASKFLSQCPDFPNSPEAIKALSEKIDDLNCVG